jgi:hypothetical protein
LNRHDRRERVTVANTTGTQPEISLVVWKGELSELEARLRLSPSEISRLRYITRNQKNMRWVVDIDLRNNSAVFNALRRRLAAGDDG